jgi:hypothetical protein
MVGLFIGVLIFAGTLSFHATLVIPVPCTGCSPTTDPALIAYRDTIRILAWVSVVTMDLAVSFSVAMAWIAGGSRGELSDGTRRGIFIFATVFLVVWLVSHGSSTCSSGASSQSRDRTGGARSALEVYRAGSGTST